MYGPSPDTKHPMEGFPQVCFIRNTVRNPNIIVGEYTYYDDPENSEDFERNVLYHFPFVGDRLVIGKFCAIARGVRFIMNGANHALSGISTYPFYIFGNGWEGAEPAASDLPYKGDTIVGNDFSRQPPRLIEYSRPGWSQARDRLDTARFHLTGPAA
jgi:virginiamycin A acetyltransferase